MPSNQTSQICRALSLTRSPTHSVGIQKPIRHIPSPFSISSTSVASVWPATIAYTRLGGYFRTKLGYTFLDFTPRDDAVPIKFTTNLYAVCICRADGKHHYCQQKFRRCHHVPNPHVQRRELFGRQLGLMHLLAFLVLLPSASSMATPTAFRLWIMHFMK